MKFRNKIYPAFLFPFSIHTWNRIFFKCLNCSLKPLDQFSPDFTWGLLSNVYCRFVQMVLHYWTSWPPCPYMEKQTLKNLPELRKLWGWILAYCVHYTRSARVVQMMIVAWPFTFFTAWSNFYPCCCGNTGKMLHGICRYAMAVLLRWANYGPWASCLMMLAVKYTIPLLFCIIKV